MTYKVAINEIELMFIGLFRVALSARMHEERLSAIRQVRQEVIASRLKEINEKLGPDWVEDQRNRALVNWLAATVGEREDAIYEFGRVSRDYEDKREHRLNVAEQIGKMICKSISDGKFQGVHSRGGILHQVVDQGKQHRIWGARDKDTVRKAWRDYRSVVHLGMAMDFIEQVAPPVENVLFVAERYRKTLSSSCPRGTRKPYVEADEQIYFSYESDICGPRLLDRGLPFNVKD